MKCNCHSVCQCQRAVYNTHGTREETAMTETPNIRLGQFLKLVGLVATGGEAKHLIQSGEVLVNDQVETRRKRQLRDGDTVTVGDQTVVVEYEPDVDAPPGTQGD